MGKKAAAKTPSELESENPLTVGADEDEAQERAASKAEAFTRPTFQAALTLAQYGHGFGDLDPLALTHALSEQVQAANDGELGRAEEILISQAHTLDAMFNNLARGAAKARGTDSSDRQLRLALKAQSQCRATLQTLSEVKNPRSTAFVQQANIAHGPQQVNNCPTSSGDAPRTRKNKNRQNELLEAQDGQRLDPGTTGTAGGADPDMETVAKVDRPKDT